MTKIIHCIKVGPVSELGDFELSCIESWKRTYPDFEIKFWTDKEILPLLSDCRYAVSCYNNGKYAFAGDYARLKILYEYGGLYMDTDVFCVERIPDACFEKDFSAWDAGFDTYWSQSGTCLYAAKPESHLIGDFIKLYQGFKDYPEFSADNTVVEYVMRDKGVNWSNRMTCQFTNQELEDFCVYNCAQFGAFDYARNEMYNVSEDVPVYLVHARSKSWMNKVEQNTYLYYAIINQDTDMLKLYDMVHRFSDMKIANPNCKVVLVLVLNTLKKNPDLNWISKWLSIKLKGNKEYMVAPLGADLDYDEVNAAFLDFITKRYNKIKFCRDIMDGKFTGELNV